MNNQTIIKEVRDSLIRLEGAINTLKKTPEVSAIRKLQGMRDKWSSLLSQLMAEENAKSIDKDLTKHLTEQLKETSA